MPAVLGRRRTRRALAPFVASGLVLAAVTAAGLVLSGRVASAAAPQLTVSRPNVVGYPNVDLVLGGVPGLGLGNPPEVAVTQSGTTLSSTTTWELSADNPLAVIVDAPQAHLADAQGLAAELVQDLPRDVPLTLASLGRTAKPVLSRDAFMADLARQPVGGGQTVSAGIAAATAAGAQHIFVVSTCASAPPARLPVGVVLDVLGVGSSCQGAWSALPTLGSGRFIPASSFTAGLAALDETVARWRSSVFVVTQTTALTPLTLSVAGGSVTVALPSHAGAGATPARAPSPRSSTDLGPLFLLLGVLALLGSILGFAWWRSRRPEPELESVRPWTQLAEPAAQPADESIAESVPEPVAGVVPEPVLQPAAEPVPEPVAGVVPEPVDQPAAEPGDVPVEPADEPVVVADVPVEPADEPVVVAAEATPAPVPGPVPSQRGSSRRPALIDLRDTDGPDVRDAPAQPTRMAVATRQLNGQAEGSQPAAVAELTSAEEPVVVAEETPEQMDTQAEVVVEDGNPEVAETTETTEIADEVAENAPADRAPERDAEATAVIDLSAAETTTMAETTEPTEQAEANEPQPASMIKRGEFEWTRLEFTPLVWRYDAEPETIDLREGTHNTDDSADAGREGQKSTVDVREKTGARQPRRRKARR